MRKIIKEGVIIVQEITHKELKELIKEYYRTKLTFLVYGRFGIGKSEVIKDVAMELAKYKDKEFVDWNRLTDSEKQKVFENCEKYFVLIDIRLSEYSSDDIKGLPEFRSDKKSIDWKVPFWALLMEKDESDGLLFFDEIANATPIVLSSCYKILYDRVINSSRVGKNWGICGASNIHEDRGYIHDIAPPLKDRAGECLLKIPNIDDWTEFAISKEIDSRIIGFLNYKPSNLHKVDYNDNQKFVSPRAWFRVNTLIKDLPLNDKFALLCKSAIGEGTAGEFVAFCKISEKLKLDELIKNPQKIKELKEGNIDIKYFLVSAVAEKYKDKKVKFEKIMEVSKVLDSINNCEIVALLWRFCSHYTEKFREDFLACKEEKFIEKYGKYI